TVLELFADFNDIVRAGQVLAKLDPSLLQTQVVQASAGLVKAEADADRTRVAVDDARVREGRAIFLSDKQLISAAALETATMDVRIAEAQVKSAVAQVAQARASLNHARVNVAHTTITSPIDGFVIARNVDAGQTVAASMSAPTLFILAGDLSRMQVKASIDESDVGNVSAGMPVTFRVDAYPTDTFVGRVTQVRLLGTAVSNVITYVTVIDVDNAGLKLKPGMTAGVTVQVAKRTDALRVPNTALRLRPNAAQLAAFGVSATAGQSPRVGAQTQTGTVWRYTGATIEKVPVRLGISDGVHTEVLGDTLKPEDLVVVSLAPVLR
ncbi:MAG: efflux RND transporter periplasmic adaptor subunit, partial [Vicinamibacterales bacterium]|nr:efflux RND transporter periplasmic adaptor subunit [Vicinamibacterales bacterium]